MCRKIDYLLITAQSDKLRVRHVAWISILDYRPIKR